MKKIKLCRETEHDWVVVGKCKDALGKHPCDYFPEGCDTCLTRFECYTKENDTYRARLTGIFYRCTKCPAVKVDGKISMWVEEKWNNIVDCRERHFLGMSEKLVNEICDRWKEKKNG